MNIRLALTLWWAGLFLEVVILARMVWTRAFKAYPVFYFYIACVFMVSAGLYLPFIASLRNAAIYEDLYWPTQLLTLVIGYAVILDISRQALAVYPGADRFVRTIGLGIFLIVFSLVGLQLAVTRGWALHVLETELERDLRVVEALFLVTIVAALSYYRIGIGKRLKGLILGMGIYVSVSVITLALVAFLGTRFEFVWKPLQSGSYLIALVVWTAAFWSYAPDPKLVLASRNVPEGDYHALAGQTRADLERLRSYFTQSAQP